MLQNPTRHFLYVCISLACSSIATMQCCCVPTDVAFSCCCTLSIVIKTDYHCLPECRFSLMYCRRQQHKDLFHSSLLLLKAQALAVTGDLKAADEAVQAWELQPERPCQTALRMPSRQKGGPAQWRQDWSACIIAKDKGNDLFRKGDFAGK